MLVAEVALIGALGHAGLGERDALTAQARAGLAQQAPERACLGGRRVARDAGDGVVWAGRDAGAAAGALVGDQQGAVVGPLEGVLGAGLDTLGAGAALAAGREHIEPVDDSPVEVPGL